MIFIIKSAHYRIIKEAQNRASLQIAEIVLPLMPICKLYLNIQFLEPKE